jgi:hypothetical protein
MDKIINYLLLTIIFVFDPLAISLVIAANFAFEQLKPKKEIMEEEWDEKRINIIGQNGNDGIHYEQENQKPLEVYGEKPQPSPQEKPLFRPPTNPQT